MDRASGSGVFARDPDAILDLIELDVTDELLKQETNKYICDVCAAYLNGLYEEWEDDVSQDDLCSQVQMMTYCKKKLFKKQYEELNEQVRLAEQQARARTAWRIEGTLREFPKFEPINVWFNYPVHCIDRVGVLKDIQPEAEKAPWQKAIGKRKTPADKKKERKQAIETAYEACGINENVTVEDLAEYMAVTEKTVRNRLKEHGGFVIEEGNVRKNT